MEVVLYNRFIVYFEHIVICKVEIYAQFEHQKIHFVTQLLKRISLNCWIEVLQSVIKAENIYVAQHTGWKQAQSQITAKWLVEDFILIYFSYF